MNTWHIITCEYPPQLGGVSDYTQLVADGLTEAGDEVHVWCPQPEVGGLRSAHGKTNNDVTNSAAVIEHSEPGSFSRADLRRVGKLLDKFPGPRRLLVQWVPHGYGYRAMNLHFCLWLWQRARRGDRVEIMVHEPYLAFWEGSWRQNGVALVHRLMTMILLRAASRVWMSIPAWENCWRPYALGRRTEFKWLPVPSNIPVIDNPASVENVRAQYVGRDKLLVGHFGTHEANTATLLLGAVPQLLQDGQPNSVLLMGQGSEATRRQLLELRPEFATRVHATGALTAELLSLHVSACDLMLQPYIDGVSSRRTSAMVGLSHGLAVITTNGRLTEPLWSQTGAVVLTPAGDAGALARETAGLLANDSERVRLGRAAAALYRERFAIEHTVLSLRSVRA
ncbi:MAG TPA: glycosyltransferase [Pyrinomonadaceae bacterium]|nr:glycosyltransferase [Pyrinomonadaceae bacterium]